MTRIPFFEILRDAMRGAKRTQTDAVELQAGKEEETPRRRVMIVGNPNVGKSVLFNRLTGHYMVVSNYPGTTVEVARGRMRLGETLYEVVDTPGMYSLRPLSEEERVGRTLLLNEAADAVLYVADAKNLERMLPFTLQLIEAGLPVILVVNMMDEAERIGVKIDLEALQKALGIPVIATAVLSGRGLEELRNAIDEFIRSRTPAAVSV
jgi:ferrous iron transport protein B